MTTSGWPERGRGRGAWRLSSQVILVLSSLATKQEYSFATFLFLLFADPLRRLARGVRRVGGGLLPSDPPAGMVREDRTSAGAAAE